jgi:vitamin B12/bleomycin/antimicrobial peptide transport system ATP-binding/permease protein
VKQLSIGVTIAAASALVAGITKGDFNVLGLATDPTLLSIGAVGLTLALTTFRSSLISPFLRVFSTIFAIEYVVTGLAYIAVRAGWWPASFSESAPPASLPTTVAIFGLLVYLISFIPVIRQITRLADPYFVTNDRGDLQIGGFDARRVTERRFASSLIVALVLINQLQVGINIRAASSIGIGSTRFKTRIPPRSGRCCSGCSASGRRSRSSAAWLSITPSPCSRSAGDAG